jgi:class 3 adenylate cyclase/tetratricopeptide (TPR) repeat protein
MDKGERRSVAVVFADLSGFTALSQTLDPEEVTDVANLCFEHLDSVIMKHGGTVDHHEGDLVMALFGAPKAHEDDPERAVKASLDMMKVVPTINRELTTKLNKPTNLGIHIGVNVGEVVLAQVGSEHKKEYTVMGDMVNIASRLCSEASISEIFVSEPVYELSKYLIDYESLALVELKGVKDPVRAFKALGTKKIPEKKRGIPDIHSRMVGRDKEFELLKRSLKERNKTILVVGTAGIGKTRLATEAKKYAEENDIQWIEGRCLSYGEDIAYRPFREIIGNIFEISNTDSTEVVKDKLLDFSKELPEDDVNSIIPYIANLFGVSMLEEKVKYLAPKDLKLQTFLAIRNLLSKVGEKKTVFVIEDFHWIDDASIELLDFIRAKPFTFLIISRPEKEKIGKLKHDLVRIDLSPLDSDSCAQLVFNLLEIAGIPDELRERILSKAAGNPFYIEEILRSLMDKGYISFRNRVWEVTKEVVELTIPPTVQGVIASRIDQLEPDERDVLQTASVIGQTFYAGVLEPICDDDLSLRLGNLEEHEFIHRSEGEYEFKHPLIHEVAYNTLLKSRRSELHKKVGERMEELFKDRISDFYPLLSRQYYYAKVWDKAYDYSIRSAKEAECLSAKAGVHFGIGQFEETREISKSALTLFRDVNDRRGEAKALNSIGNAYCHMGKDKGALKCYHDSLRIVKDFGDRESEVKLLNNIGSLCRAFGQVDREIDYYLSALKISEEIGDKKSQQVILGNFANVYELRGQYEEAMKHLKSSLGIGRETGYKSGEASVLYSIGFVCFCLGEHQEALESLQLSLSIAREIGNERMEADTLLFVGEVHYRLGNHDLAIQSYGDALNTARERASRRSEGIALVNMGVIHKDKKEMDKAYECLNSAKEIMEEIGEKEGVLIAKLQLGSFALDTGHLDEAEDHAESASRLADELRAMPHKAETALLLGRLNSARYKWDEAKSHFDDALKSFEELSQPFELAQTHYYFGCALKKRGDEKHHKHLEEAHKIFKRIGSKNWADRVSAELRRKL